MWEFLQDTTHTAPTFLAAAMLGHVGAYYF